MWLKSPAVLGGVASILVLVASGVVQGRLNGRWAASPDLGAAVARLKQLPLQVGDWRGTDDDPDLATLRRAGIAGGVLRRYRNAATGSTLTAMLVCGRPGPVSVHTPDVCYVGSGYEMAAEPREVIPNFRAARMVRPRSASGESLSVYWSWNAADRWEATVNPRLTYGAKPYLYKLYVVGPSGESPDLAKGPIADFAGELIKECKLQDPILARH